MNIGIIGGGAAGISAAIAASENCRVTVLEQNEKIGKKLYITGKGRCNLTNDCLPADFLQNVVSNPKFLRSAIYRLPPQKVIDFCQTSGLPLKTERGNRVFPQSDKSSDVIKFFGGEAQKRGVNIMLNCRVESVEKRDEKFFVNTSLGAMVFDKLIVATGGYSYRATGSDGFGYKLAENFGHKIVPLRPALCRILCRNTAPLQGLSLKNAEISYVCNGKSVSEFGELLFTDDGVSGPAALSLSSRINRVAKQSYGEIKIDLKPALDSDKLDARVLRDFSERFNKDFCNALDALLPRALIPEVVRQSGIPPQKKVNQITSAERAKLVAAFKGLSFPFVSLDDINFGIVTSGGVDVREVNPSTMESRLVNGLYFVGELLDVDALTGGYNIQIALSTGYIAGIAASAATD